jgi:hypothetical protein
MAQFTARFDAFIERGRKQVLEERNQFHINLAELQGTASRHWSPPKHRLIGSFRGRTNATARY